MKIIITLEDGEDGAVRIEEVKYPGNGEHLETITSASLLAEEMLAHISQHGETEAISDNY